MNKESLSTHDEEVLVYPDYDYPGDVVAIGKFGTANTLEITSPQLDYDYSEAFDADQIGPWDYDA